MSEKVFHPFTPVCRSCERTVKLEKLGFASDGQMEVLGACAGGHVVRVEMHVIQAIAEAAVVERTHRSVSLTPFADITCPTEAVSGC